MESNLSFLLLTRGHTIRGYLDLTVQKRSCHIEETSLDVLNLLRSGDGGGGGRGGRGKCRTVAFGISTGASGLTIA